MAVQIAAALREASNRLADLIAQYAARRREISRQMEAQADRLQPDVLLEERERLLDEAQTEALTGIDQIDQSADDEIEQVRRAVDRELSASGVDEVLVEMRRSRIADRLLRILDNEYARSRSIDGALDSAVDFAQEAEDPQETFLVLRGELPAWVRAHDDVLRIPNHLMRLDKAMRPHLTGDQLQAIEALEELEAGVHRVAEAVALARHAIRRGDVGLRLATHLPGWTVGHDVQISSGS